MTRKNLVIAAIVLMIAGSVVSNQATPQSFTLAGKILSVKPMAFTVKLYPPLKSGKRVLLTTSSIAGDFQFAAAPGSYLLEVYSGKQLVYQQVVQLTNNQKLTIDLRKSAKRAADGRRSTQI
jgi:hypothetical protein